jgi:hypothetical protein
MNPRKALKTFKALPVGTKVELLLYPVFLLWQMPIAWVKSLWYARVLLNGQWDRYMGFSANNAINSLFYRTQWININRYGRKGLSPVLGLGAYPLLNWFHLSSLASYIYANAGAVVTLLGTLVWVFSHLSWLEVADPIWVLAVTFSLFFSSTAYAMAFARQNYQILGWMWLPTALYAITSGHWALGAMAWFAAAMFGITPVFFAVPMMSAVAWTSDSWMPLATIFPALIYTAGRFYPLIQGGNLKSAISSMAKLIGMTSRQVRYHRQIKRLSLGDLYFTVLYFTGAALAWWVSNIMPALLMLGAALYVINQRYFRVADDQSMIMITASLWAAALMDSSGRWELLGIFWLIISPMGMFILIQRLEREKGMLHVEHFKPFDHYYLMHSIEVFFRPVKAGETVYLAFADPEGAYFNIFDGYREIHEVPLCVAAKKGFHLFPDWYAVQETNYDGAPQCWGRSVGEVKQNCSQWNASYAVVYQETSSVLDIAWQRDFDLVSEFDWGLWVDSFHGAQLWPEENPAPKLFLIRLRTCFDVDAINSEPH